MPPTRNPHSDYNPTPTESNNAIPGLLDNAQQIVNLYGQVRDIQRGNSGPEKGGTANGDAPTKSALDEIAEKVIGLIPQDVKDSAYRAGESDYKQSVITRYAPTGQRILIGAVTLVAGVYIAKKLKVLK